MKRVLIVVLLAGCSTIDPQNRVEGWPDLMPIEHHISFNKVQETCKPFVSWGMRPLACATFNFRDLECHIYYAFDWALDHERQHCKGYDHPGSDDMRVMLRGWKGRGQ